MKEDYKEIKQLFVRLLNFYIKKLRISIVIKYKFDCRQVAGCWVKLIQEGNEEQVLMSFNPKYFSKLSRKMRTYEILSCVLHELGHIKKRAFSCLKIFPNVRDNEFIAETQCLKWLKKYRPFYYRVRVLKMRNLVRNECWLRYATKHASSMLKIKEYVSKC